MELIMDYTNTLTWSFIALVWLHFLGDFILQTDEMAINKSKSIKWLSIHCFIYGTVFLPFFGWQFAAATFLFHWITDFWTSRATSYLYEKNRHWFFVMIGFDQAIHFTTLFLTLFYFIN